MSLAELFGMKETWRQWMRRARHERLRKRDASRFTFHVSRFTLESLEPRILLSGTPGPIVLDQAVPETGLASVMASAQSTPVVLLDSGTQSGSGALASSADIQPQALPAAPTAVSAIDRVNDAGSAIALTWIPSASGGVTQQRIYRSTTTGGPLNDPYVLVATITNNTTTSFTDTGLTTGTPYFYMIRAFSATDGESAFSISDEVTATSSSQVTKTWVGGATGTWTAGGNWNGGTAPGPTDVVSIGSGVTVISGSTSSVAGIFGAGNVTVSANTLTVSSLIEIAGGTVTVDGAMTVGSLSMSNGTLQGTGTVKIGRASCRERV